MYLMSEKGNISLHQIGEALGVGDHTTVMYGCEKIATLLGKNDKICR
jgi:chromosomal replication initiator protein